MSTLKELKKMKEEAKKAMQEKGQEALLKEFNQFFADNPGVSAIAWTQYTPYFNDGDACTFRVNDMYACVSKFTKSVKDDFGGYGEDEGWVGPYSSTKDITGVATALKAFNRDVVDNELFQMTFGDHVKVFVTPGKVETEEYERD